MKWMLQIFPTGIATNQYANVKYVLYLKFFICFIYALKLRKMINKVVLTHDLSLNFFTTRF